MIRIIKEGDTVNRIKCDWCGTIFEFEYEDLRISCSHRNTYKSLLCPKCGHIIFPKQYNKQPHRRSLLERIFF